MRNQQTNGEVYHHMSYRQREQLKHFSSECASSGDIESMRSTLIMIAHFMRQRVDVPFQEYASHWCAARNNDRLIATPAMRALWPAPQERHIADGCSDYQGMGGL